MSGPLRKAASVDDRDLLALALGGEYGPVEQEDLDEALIRASSNGNDVCASRLLEEGADPDAVDTDGDTPLMLASSNGHNGVVSMLMEAGADIDLTSDRGRTALHMAAWNNRYQIARKLLLQGCITDVREVYGDTALMLACRRGHAQVLRLLLEHECSHDACSDELDTALHYAARYGHLNCLTLLLRHCDWDLEHRNIWGMTPLLYAVHFKKTDCCKALLQVGADPNAADLTQRSVLHYAAKMKAEECSKLLIRKGANLNVSDPDGATPLMDAISVNSAATVQYLIQAGCNVDIVGKATIRRRYVWSTPFQAALRNGYIPCAKMLYFAGCPLGEKPEEDIMKEIAVEHEDIMEKEGNEWLNDAFSVPRSLSTWCRIGIHHSLGRYATTLARTLPLPKGLQLYVAYYDFALLIDKS